MKYKDQLNRTIEIPNRPQRIVSLVPSQTELLYDLGLKDRLVGQTVFCIHPERYFKSATKIGGTKKLNIEKIISLKPDLIIANKEENEKDQIEELASHFPVWISDVNTFQDALDMIKSIGEITESQAGANEIIESINHSRNSFLAKKMIRKKAIYLIWQNPYIAAGTNTFINTMMYEAGFINSITESRYPEISIDEIKNIDADLVFLSSEPFPFKLEQKEELDKIIGSKKCRLVDGELFSWYGSRLIKAYHYFGKLV